jgi:hypothetical protein
MNRKAFRCGVLALLLTAAFALPAISATSSISRVPARPGLHSPRPTVERGFLERAWDLVTGLFGSPGGGLRSLYSANRGGIDPNGQPIVDPQANSLPPGSNGSGDNRGGIDPNG